MQRLLQLSLPWFGYCLESFSIHVSHLIQLCGVWCLLVSLLGLLVDLGRGFFWDHDRWIPS
jgi:hypothetical protein